MGNLVQQGSIEHRQSWTNLVIYQHIDPFFGVFMLLGPLR